MRIGDDYIVRVQSQQAVAIDGEKCLIRPSTSFAKASLS